MSKKMTCKGECKKSRLTTYFYTSTSNLFDGYVPICKQCLKEMINENDIESVKVTLQRIDKPFIAKVWKSAEDNDSDTVGSYFRMINSLQQYKTSTWADSDFEGENQTDVYKHKFDDIDGVEEIETENGVIKLSKEIIMKFGAGYINREYLAMEKFYQDMFYSHTINTPQLKQQLVLMCNLKILMARALEQQDDKMFKNFNDRYEKILQSSGFRPIDRKSSDEASGIRSFGVIFEEVEKLGYREPKPIEERMDLVDMIILENLNYTRKIIGHERLMELPEEIHDSLEKANGTLASDRGDEE